MEKSTWCEPTLAFPAWRLKTRRGSHQSVSSLRFHISPPQASRYIPPSYSHDFCQKVLNASVSNLHPSTGEISSQDWLSPQLAALCVPVSQTYAAVYLHQACVSSRNLMHFCCFPAVLNLEPCLSNVLPLQSRNLNKSYCSNLLRRFGQRGQQRSTFKLWDSFKISSAELGRKQLLMDSDSFPFAVCVSHHKRKCFSQLQVSKSSGVWLWWEQTVMFLLHI